MNAADKIASKTRALGRVAAYTLIAILAGCGTGTSRLSSYADVTSEIQRGRWVELTAYTLRTDQPITQLLARKAASGARVNVVLAGQGFDYALQQNADVTRLLRGRGAHVDATNYPLHTKLLVTPASTIVSDTNFSSRGLYFRLTRVERDAALQAFAGVDAYSGDFTTTKGRSLMVEAALLDEGHGAIAVESESFGPDNPVYGALTRALAAHRPVTVIVNRNDAQGNAQENDALAQLKGHGAQIYLSRASEKIAVNGSTCWSGSSNSSPGLLTQVDWGLRIDDPNVCRVLLSRLTSNAAN